MANKNKDKWSPMREAVVAGPEPEAVIVETMRIYGEDREAALKRLDADVARCRYYLNDIYQVEVRLHEGGMAQMNIRRRDGKPIFRDWRHFQRIKNEIIGPECEAVELYPAESRLVDTSNKYHLWCVTDPKFRFPFGFDERDVYTQAVDGPKGSRGLKQRRIG